MFVVVLFLYGGDNVKQNVCVMRKNGTFTITIEVLDAEIENKTDEEIAEIVENKIRIEMNKLIYGKRGV